VNVFGPLLAALVQVLGIGLAGVGCSPGYAICLFFFRKHGEPRDPALERMLSLVFWLLFFAAWGLAARKG
jgi:hypothetical protein